MNYIETMRNLKIKIENCNYEYNYYRKYIKKAILDFESNINKYKNDEEFLTYLGILYLYHNDAIKSLEIIKKAYEINPNIQTITNLAYFFLVEGDYENEEWEESPQKAINLLKKSY